MFLIMFSILQVCYVIQNLFVECKLVSDRDIYTVKGFWVIVEEDKHVCKSTFKQIINNNSNNINKAEHYTILAFFTRATRQTIHVHCLNGIPFFTCIWTHILKQNTTCARLTKTYILWMKNIYNYFLYLYINIQNITSNTKPGKNRQIYIQ